MYNLFVKNWLEGNSEQKNTIPVFEELIDQWMALSMGKAGIRIRFPIS